jgi:hypothetical protein
VVGASGLVAFRTREASQDNQVLHGDGDDDVLQVYDPSTGRVLNTGLAVTPCMLEACDPRAPYRVLNDTVKFLTFESAQGAAPARAPLLDPDHHVALVQFGARDEQVDGLIHSAAGPAGTQALRRHRATGRLAEEPARVAAVVATRGPTAWWW